MGSLVVTAKIRNSDTSEELAVNSLAVSTSGDAEDSGRISVGTSETTLTFKTDIGNAGYMLLINRDETNYVQVGFAATTYYLRLLAGQTALIPIEPALTDLYLKANSAACKVQYKLYEA